MQAGCWWSGGRAWQRTLDNGTRSVCDQVDAIKTTENSWAEAEVEVVLGRTMQRNGVNAPFWHWHCLLI